MAARLALPASALRLHSWVQQLGTRLDTPTASRTDGRGA
eukprot:COSAG02_NODE_58881_length_276_cov_0.576271_1_plen_38_part_10